MTIFGKIISCFPILHLTLIAVNGLWLLQNPTAMTAVSFLAMVYVLPLWLFRIHNVFCCVQEGKSRLDVPVYSAWWASHMFQSTFNAFPFLESLLRLIPGAYSLWLRCWGSKIGKGIYWTAQVEIIDRSLVEVGDYVIFGHKVTIVSHVITRKNGKIRLYVKHVQIGSLAFIGAGGKFGPGTEIAPGQTTPFETVLTINQKL